MTIGRPDLSHSLTFLNRFGACPQEYHLDLTVRIFSYLKCVNSPKIAIDSSLLEYERSVPFHKLIPDFLQDYPYVCEEIDCKFLQAFGPVLGTTILVDSDHAHNLKTRRSLTVLINFVHGTPVLWISCRQGVIASSTYAA